MLAVVDRRMMVVLLYRRAVCIPAISTKYGIPFRIWIACMPQMTFDTTGMSTSSFQPTAAAFQTFQTDIVGAYVSTDTMQ
jgi:hypothetical protein